MDKSERPRIKESEKANNDNNYIHLMKAIASIFIWGLGQLFNRQYIKALFFFAFFILLVGIELGTSHYFTQVDPYQKINGNDFPSTLASDFEKKYEFSVANKLVKGIPDYDAYYEKAAQDGNYTNDELYAYVMQDLDNHAIQSDGVTTYVETPFSKIFTQYMGDLYNRPDSNYDSTDYNKMLIRIYFYHDTDMKQQFETSYYNFYYDKAGFFIKGIWGIITLGTTPSEDIYQHKALSVLVPHINNGTIILSTTSVYGHPSAYILLKAIIALLLLCYFMIVYVWNVIDAWKTSKIIHATKVVPKAGEYFKKVYENSFEYIALLPALFVVTFITIMPIIFGFLVAFTQYDGTHNFFFRWDGIHNFLRLAHFGGDKIPFGKVFPQVFAWTLIWAVFSTITVFFGGFFQAVILNNKRVIFRKFWRTFLILPWAIPALISQMIFRIMLNENGFVNNVLKYLGAYKVLFKYGMLGKDGTQLHGLWQHLLYFGNQNIQWLSNPFNPTFVKVVLIVVNIWLGFPFFMALMTGVMTSIDKTLYEAAEIDGATSYRKFKYITFPMVISNTAPLLIMTFSGNFNNFGVIYFITDGGYGNTDVTRAFAGQTDIFISWMYRLTTSSTTHMYNMASVFSILIFLVIGSITHGTLLE